MTVDTEQLSRILADHKAWLADQTTGQRADLQGANLQRANLDFAAWPLWCGSRDAILDNRLARQLMAHIAVVTIADADPDVMAAHDACRIAGAQSHRAYDLGLREDREG